jgi:hypothetical protein
MCVTSTNKRRAGVEQLNANRVFQLEYLFLFVTFSRYVLQKFSFAIQTLLAN